MHQHRVHPGGFVKDLTNGVSAGQPAVRYGGVRAHRTPVRPDASGVVDRLLGRDRPTVACAHAMAHAGGAA